MEEATDVLFREDRKELLQPRGGNLDMNTALRRIRHGKAEGVKEFAQFRELCGRESHRRRETDRTVPEYRRPLRPLLVDDLMMA